MNMYAKEPHMFRQSRILNGIQYLEAFVLDELLQPIHDVDISIIINVHKITSVEPTVFLQNRSSCFGIV